MEMKICIGPLGILPNGSFCIGPFGMLPSGSFAPCATAGRLATRMTVLTSAAGGFAARVAVQTSADAGAAAKNAQAIAQAAPAPMRIGSRGNGDITILLARQLLNRSSPSRRRDA